MIWFVASLRITCCRWCYQYEERRVASHPVVQRHGLNPTSFEARSRLKDRDLAYCVGQASQIHPPSDLHPHAPRKPHCCSRRIDHCGCAHPLRLSRDDPQRQCAVSILRRPEGSPWNAACHRETAPSQRRLFLRRLHERGARHHLYSQSSWFSAVRMHPAGHSRDGFGSNNRDGRRPETHRLYWSLDARRDFPQ